MTRNQEQMEKAKDKSAYADEMKDLHISRRRRKKLEAKEDIQEVVEINERYGVAPKKYAAHDNLVHLIDMVLKEGISGTKAIRKYAELKGKSKQWIDEVAKPRAGKGFKAALLLYEPTPFIKPLKKNKIYNRKNILNNTITGALTELSKQVKVSRLIDELRSKVVSLKEQLAARTKGEDWRPEALRLHAEGESYRKIEERLGVPRSTVADFLKGK